VAGRGQSPRQHVVSDYSQPALRLKPRQPRSALPAGRADDDDDELAVLGADLDALSIDDEHAAPLDDAQLAVASRTGPARRAAHPVPLAATAVDMPIAWILTSSYGMFVT
jgi:hypothetical protein